MSGLAGRCSPGAAASSERDREALFRILDRISHRGPETLWLETSPRMSLGLVDIDRGTRPGTPRYHASALGSAIMDGEIYDLPKTAPDGSGGGLELVTSIVRTGDTGDLACLNGEYALAARAGDTAYLTRDPLGIKPLFWIRQGKGICFASEIKALKDEGGRVEEFPPGHLWKMDLSTGEESLDSFQGLPQAGSQLPTVERAVREIRLTMKRAVQRRMRDGRVRAVFLSGGLDSSIIAALAVKENPDIHTITVGMEGGQDLEHALIVARHLGTSHHEHIYDKDEILRHLPEIIYHFESYDQATLRSCIANYFATTVAARYTDVVLSGEGSDELYGGYEHMRGAAVSNERMNSLTGELVDSMRYSGLQRLDRMVSCHGVEVRMPFLDPDVMGTALEIPARWKVDPASGTEKWILRKAFENLLPREVAWREKSRFSEGAGSSGVIEDLAGDMISDQEFERERDLCPSTIVSKEELFYYRLYRKSYPEPHLGELVTAWRQ